MLNNYHYFIALAEKKNISKAAESLFISHQCLSKYLKNLEEEYHIDFFYRSPQLSLTPAGQVYYEMVKQVQLLEDNSNSQLDDIRQAKRGLLRFGTTEGRYRILVPHLMSEFKKLYPDVELKSSYSTTDQLCTAVVENNLDIALVNQSIKQFNQLNVSPILEEHMYLVISDNMLKRYFPSEYPVCKHEFSKGVNLRRFQKIPFVLSPENMNARKILNEYLQINRIELNVVSEITQTDLHFMLSAKDYAASFCWSMYIPAIRQENRDTTHSHLNVFPIENAQITNRVMLISRTGRIFPKYGTELIKTIRHACFSFSDINLETI